VSDSDETAVRSATIGRKTLETSVKVRLDLDGTGYHEVNSGLPFFDHMLCQLAKHGRMDLWVEASGDLVVDAHHTVEDVGIAFGRALGAALGERRGIRRFWSCSVPLDEALVEVALDLSGRPFLHWAVRLPESASALGTPAFDPHLAEDFWAAAVVGAGLTVHVESRRGRSPHHILEAAFKAMGLAIREAACVVGHSVPSTKGSLG